MAYAPHQHPVEDISNLSRQTKAKLKGGDLNYATSIDSGVFASVQVPWDAVLTQGGNILVDSRGNILVSRTNAVGRQNNIARSIAITTPVPSTLLLESQQAFLEEIISELYYRIYVQTIAMVPTLVASTESYATVEGGESPYSGDLIVLNDLAYIRNLDTGLYHEIHAETVMGVVQIYISTEDYDIAEGAGSITTGNLIWLDGKAYLKNTDDGLYYEWLIQIISTVATPVVIGPSSIASPTSGTLLLDGGFAYLEDTVALVYHRIYAEDVDGVASIIATDTTYSAPTGGGSPFTGELIVYNGLGYVYNRTRSAYNQIWAENIGGVASIVLSDSTTTITLGNGDISSGDLIWLNEKAYLRNQSTNLYHELFINIVAGAPTVLLSDLGAVTLPDPDTQFTGTLIVYGGRAYIENITTGLYREIYVESVSGTASILLSDAEGFIAAGDGVSTTGNLIWSGTSAYLKAPATGLYHEFHLETISGVSTFVVANTGITISSGDSTGVGNNLVWRIAEAYLKNTTDGYYRKIYAETVSGSAVIMNSDLVYT